jgi:hypothetical protein
MVISAWHASRIEPSNIGILNIYIFLRSSDAYYGFCADSGRNARLQCGDELVHIIFLEGRRRIIQC